MDSDQEDLETADKRSTAAKQSLRNRLHELERRVTEAKETFDVAAKITSHPRIAVGIAAGAGALLGFLSGGGTRTRAPAMGESEKRSLGGAIFAALGAIAVQALKDYAMREGADMAQKWWADREDRDTSVDSRRSDTLRH